MIVCPGKDSLTERVKLPYICATIDDDARVVTGLFHSIQALVDCLKAICKSSPGDSQSNRGSQVLDQRLRRTQFGKHAS